MLVISLFLLSPRKMRDRSQSIIHLNPKQRLPTAVPHKNVRGVPLPCKRVLFFPGVSYVLNTTKISLRELLIVLRLIY